MCSSDLPVSQWADQSNPVLSMLQHRLIAKAKTLFPKGVLIEGFHCTSIFSIRYHQELSFGSNIALVLEAAVSRYFSRNLSCL